jgi:imidazole glycerol-phosphate synthase subunit HisH
VIVVLDYGMGNLRSVSRALDRLGAPHEIRTDLAGASKLIIPGVGAFGAAMARLSPLREAIRTFAAEGNPVMGICLGQQLLFDESEEMGSHVGLGIVPGKVRYLSATGLKVPHMGWSPITPDGETPITKGVQGGDQVYFVHSLVTHCDEPSDVAAWAEYGERFAAMIQRGAICGTQFHPEKSGDVGLGILENFVSC